MKPTRLAVAALLGLYGIWAAGVIASYFVLPFDLPDRVSVFGGHVGYPAGWAQAMVESARSVAGAMVVLLAGRGAGALVRARILPFERPLENSLFRLAMGLTILSLLSQVAAYLGVYTHTVVAGGGIALAIAGVVAAGRDIASIRLPRVSGTDLPYLAVASAAVLMALVGALAPEIEYDALWYHLWLPRQWLAAGHPVDAVEEYISLYPLSWDLAYGLALAVSGAGAAKLVHFACLPLLAAATWRLARELTPDASPALAAALTVTAPTLIWEATTAYVDLALAWYLALMVLALVHYWRTQDRRWLIISGVMLGGAMSTKHLGLVALAIVGVLLTGRELAHSRRFTPTIRTALLFSVVALAVPAPWYARAFVNAGNPVFPDLYRVFGASPAERWDDATERSLTQFKTKFGGQRTAAHLLTLPWDLTMHGARYGGTFGPLFLLLIPAALLPGTRMRHRGAVLGGCLAYIAVWASPISSFQLRFLVPLVPLLAVLGAAGAGRIADLVRSLSTNGSGVVSVALAALLAFNLPIFIEAHDKDRHHGGWWLTHVMRYLPLAVVIGAESREQYLERQVSSYAAWRFINHTLADTAYVLTFSGGDHFYSERRRLWSDAAAARPVTWGAGRGSEIETHAMLLRMGISHVLLDLGQVSDGSVRNLAIASDRMRACCLYPIYTDERFALYEVTRVAGESVTHVSAKIGHRSGMSPATSPGTSK